MGAWGTGNFENDDALDLLGGLAPGEAEPLEKLFDAACSAGMEGKQIDASTAAQALAAAELVCAARGHASDDLPDDAIPLVKALKKPAPDLVEKAISAVSYALAHSELVELWAESDEPEGWNRVATGLVARLDAPVRSKKLSKKQRETVSRCVCSFCGELIPLAELVTLDMRRPWSDAGVSRGIFAHEGCLNAKLHPRHIVQWWTPPEL
ncbi:MAG: DUF4259 domain-containing protein [Acidobacteria bacterium]|nr:DUF4259 domain-containing protein [Acidobacteriota bacterium]